MKKANDKVISAEKISEINFTVWPALFGLGFWKRSARSMDTSCSAQL